MPFIDWDESFSTQIEHFDRDHKHLVGLLNKTFDDFISGAPDTNLEIVLNGLINYANYHFAAEEEWMIRNSYPKFVEHKAEHDGFRQDIIKLNEGFHSGKQRISLDVLTFLKKWFKNHLLECDAGYALFIKTGEQTALK